MFTTNLIYIPKLRKYLQQELSPNHILWWHSCPSERICAIDPKSFDQVLYPKDVLVVLKEIWKS